MITRVPIQTPNGFQHHRFSEIAPQMFNFLLERNWKSAASLTLGLHKHVSHLLCQHCDKIFALTHRIPGSDFIQGENTVIITLRVEDMDFCCQR